jgi:putative ABC transport system ATP-binding protein
MIGDVVIRCEGLSRTYGSGENIVHALQDAALDVRAGELVVLRGPSGSGKTTLLNMLGGLDTPTSGRVWLGEREVTGASEAELIDMRRRELGYIFQTFALLPVLSAAENVELPMRILGLAAAERDARVAELLEIVGLAPHANQRPGELSGGQQQRLGIARALANDPKLIIADEPTGQLDSTNAEAMMSLIAALVHQRGVAAIVSTHDPRMAAHADRIIEIHDGRVGRRRGRHASDAEPDTAPVRIVRDESAGVERQPPGEPEQHDAGDPVQPVPGGGA